MMKDIFIDNNIAKNFANPMDAQYKKLIQWLMKNDNEKQENNAFLAVSKKLIVEYIRSSGSSNSASSIPIIINKLTREGRLNRISNIMIKEFQKNYFSKKILKNLKSNIEDREHIPVVLLSYRKYALSLDNNLINDLISFPGFKVTVAKRPKDINYEL